MYLSGAGEKKKRKIIPQTFLSSSGGRITQRRKKGKSSIADSV
jgi:hypothetical protein